MAELVDAPDSKSGVPRTCRFDSDHPHHPKIESKDLDVPDAKRPEPADVFGCQAGSERAARCPVDPEQDRAYLGTKFCSKLFEFGYLLLSTRLLKRTRPCNS